MSVYVSLCVGDWHLQDGALADVEALASQIAMHVVAAKPLYLTVESIPEEALAS